MDGSKKAVALMARILIALIFILMGAGKLAAQGATIQYIQSVGIPGPSLAFWGAVALETTCGVLILIGYQTRAAALALAAFTIIAAALFHSDFADQNQFTHFMKNLSMAGGLLLLVAMGPGGLSLDSREKNDA